MAATHPPQRAATIPCRYYQRGFCSRGDACWFKHDPAANGNGDVRSMSMSTSSSSSTPFSNTLHSPVASTSRLDPAAASFPFEHATLLASSCASVSGTTSQPQPQTQAQLQQQTQPQPQHDTTSQDDTSNCIICFERPDKYGLLESCSHVFCLTCIREWRTEKGKSREQIEGGVLKRCPACRSTSNYVIPSNVVFLATQQAAKAEFIQGYKARLAQIPCKHFVRSLDQGRSGRFLCPFGKDCFYKHTNPDGTPHVFTHGMADHILASRQSRDVDRLERHLRNFYRMWRTGRLDDMRDPDYGFPGFPDTEDEDEEEEEELYDDDEEEVTEEEIDAGDWLDEDDRLGGDVESEDDYDEEEYENMLAEAIRRSLRDMGRQETASNMPPSPRVHGHRGDSVYRTPIEASLADLERSASPQALYGGTQAAHIGGVGSRLDMANISTFSGTSTDYAFAMAAADYYDSVGEYDDEYDDDELVVMDGIAFEPPYVDHTSARFTGSSRHPVNTVTPAPFSSMQRHPVTHTSREVPVRPNSDTHAPLRRAPPRPHPHRSEQNDNTHDAGVFARTGFARVSVVRDEPPRATNDARQRGPQQQQRGNTEDSFRGPTVAHVGMARSMGDAQGVPSRPSTNRRGGSERHGTQDRRGPRRSSHSLHQGSRHRTPTVIRTPTAVSAMTEAQWHAFFQGREGDE